MNHRVVSSFLDYISNLAAFLSHQILNCIRFINLHNITVSFLIVHCLMQLQLTTVEYNYAVFTSSQCNLVNQVYTFSRMYIWLSRWVQIIYPVATEQTLNTILSPQIFYRSGVTPNNEQGTAWTPVEHAFSVDMLEAGGSCLWVYGRDNLLYVRTGMGFHSTSANVSRIGPHLSIFWLYHRLWIDQFAI